MLGISRKSSYHQHYHPEETQGICVVCREGELNDELCKRFRKKFSKSGLAKELRDKMFYQKPSVKKRKKRLQAIRLIQREEEKAVELKDKLQKMKIKRARQKAKLKRKGVANNGKSSVGQNNS